MAVQYQPTTVYPWVFAHFRIGPHSRILELGCGTGHLWLANQDQISTGWGITFSDFSPAMVKDAQRTLQATGRPFTFSVIDAQALPQEDASCDAFIANNMLYHVPDHRKALSEIRRVLRPGCQPF